MTGLENILSQIMDDAKRESNEQLAAAKAQAEEIITAAKEEAAKLAQAVLDDGEEKAKSIRDRADSAAQLERRNSMLKFKQQVIREVIEETRSSLENAPADEYFDIILKLVARFATAGEAEMRMNQRDLDRMPMDFAAALKQAAPETSITVANTAYNIESGFVLVYGGIDINCTFRAIFEDAEGELRDAVGKILFTAA